ncbi:hypothetical protein GpartN1_g1205.t1 [Galdieria partita]|uniref:Prefoldin subunit 4 n=1 Tax=Galdieria partita TaxID=83374 RepID=A0A9C7UN28_9RHOD|nr:hypothetical protein GpartN1_g1205.t1 [Galdieria partita]
MTTAFSNYEVTAEDQQRINYFSRLVTQKVDLVEERKKLKQEKEKLEDAQLELELLDEDTEVHRRIGECYVLVKQSQAVQFLNTEKESLESKLQETEDKLEKIKVEMDELKKILYGKFGSAINLEEEDEDS